MKKTSEQVISGLKKIRDKFGKQRQQKLMEYNIKDFVKLTKEDDKLIADIGKYLEE